MKLVWLALLISPLLQGAVALHCGTLLNPAQDTVAKDVWVLTDGGTVREIRAKAPMVGVTTVDLTKGFCLPGLMDVHDHLTGDATDQGYSALGISIPIADDEGGEECAHHADGGIHHCQECGRGRV